MVEGVTDGFEKRLEIQGVGYRAQLRARRSSCARLLPPGLDRGPGGIEFEVPQPTEVDRPRIDKQLVGETPPDPQRRPPEPYKGKGVRYAGEHVAARSGSGA
jgi:large subunit ribosomal protein L6